MTVVLVGATGLGKSALAISLARWLAGSGFPAEIVNADSMLVYRGMDIGTAKPTLAERDGIPHHLIDILDITETATVADFQTLARDAISGCRQRGVLPILVGGSALYVRAIVDDFSFPGTDPTLRAELETEAVEHGTAVLYERLRRIDPAAAAEIQPENTRRVIRALEVITLTGEPYPATLPGFDYVLPDVLQIGLDAPRAALDERIASRVHQMWRQGIVAEVRQLELGGLRHGLTASRGLGYRQILSFLAGDITEEEARQQTITGTRKFARRQGGWFRRDQRISWLDARAGDLVQTALALMESGQRLGSDQRAGLTGPATDGAAQTRGRG